MTGAKASGPFAGGRGRRGEEYPSSRLRAAAVARPTTRCPRLPGSCRRVDERARARHARARQGGARGPDLRLRGATSGRRHTRSSRRSPVGADVHRTLPDMRGRSWTSAHARSRRPGAYPKHPCPTGAPPAPPSTASRSRSRSTMSTPRRPGTAAARQSRHAPGSRGQGGLRETRVPAPPADGRPISPDEPSAGMYRGPPGRLLLSERKPRRTHRRQRSSNPASSAGARRCLTTACSATVLPPHRQDGRCPPRRHRGRDARQRRAPARKTGRKRYSARRTSPCSQDGARAPPAGSRTRPVGTGRSAV